MRSILCCFKARIRTKKHFIEELGIKFHQILHITISIILRDNISTNTMLTELEIGSMSPLAWSVFVESFPRYWDRWSWCMPIERYMEKFINCKKIIYLHEITYLAIYLFHLNMGHPRSRRNCIHFVVSDKFEVAKEFSRRYISTSADILELFDFVWIWDF